MKIIASLLIVSVATVFGGCRSERSEAMGTTSDESNVLDYDKMILLDAEDLAEGGIAGAYAKLLPHLRALGVEPAEVIDDLKADGSSYAVHFDGERHLIYSESTDPVEAWAFATFTLFSIVNRQLPPSGPRLYAINGGNDLGGMFLTDDVVARARASMQQRRDWPYIPTQDGPWYGQEH